MNIFLQPFLLFLALITISFLLSYFWKRIFFSSKYLFLVFPGVVIHELSHAVGCLITGAKITKIKFFSKKGGFVRHKKPKIPILGSVIISFFPLVGGVFFLFLLFNFFFPVTFSDPNFNIDFINELYQLFSENYSNWKFWALLYMITSIIICIIPSKKDFKNSFFGLSFLFLFSRTALYFDFWINELNYLALELEGILTYAIIPGVISLSVAFIIYLIKSIFSKLISAF